MKKIITLSVLIAFSFVASAQKLTSISPNSAKAGQTLDVTITGTNTHFTQGSGTFVSFSFGQGSGTVNKITIVNDNTLSANIIVPFNTYKGYYSVYVNNYVDGYLSLYNGFYVDGKPQPILSKITPSTGNAGQTLDVMITGLNTNFKQGSGTSVYFYGQGSGTIPVNNVTVIDDVTLIANISISANPINGYYGVYVYDYSSSSLYLTQWFLCGNKFH